MTFFDETAVFFQFAKPSLSPPLYIFMSRRLLFAFSSLGRLVSRTVFNVVLLLDVFLLCPARILRWLLFPFAFHFVT